MKRLFNNTFLRNTVKSLCILVIVILEYIGVSYYYADIRLLVFFTAFLLFYVMLPGAFILTRIGLGGEHLSTTVIRSFFTGFVLNILIYFICELSGADCFLYSVGPVLSVIFIIILGISSRSCNGKSLLSAAAKIIRTVWNAPVSFYIFIVCIFASSILTTQYTYISPAHAAYSSIKLDFGYHAGVINALSAGFPPQDPWIDGLTLQYHYFTELLLSIPVRLFDMPSEELLLSGTPILITPVLSVAVYSFFKEFSGRKDRAGLYCLSVHFSNMFMIKAFASSWFLYHIYSNINNAGMGLACLLTLLPILKFLDRPSEATNRAAGLKTTLFLSVMVMLCTGIKGPIAIVFIGGLIGTLALSALLGRFDVRMLAATLLSSASFLLVYVYVIGSQGAGDTNETGGSLLNAFEVTDIFFIKPEIMEALHGSRMLQWATLFIVFCLFLFTAFILPFICGYIRELFLVLARRREFLVSRVTIYACCMVGFLGMMVLNFSGHSQVYLGFVTSMLVPVIAFWFLEDMHGSRSYLYKLAKYTFCIGIILTSLTVMLDIFYSSVEAHDLWVSHDKNRSKYRNVTTQEYEGLIWLRDNTAEDALIASDRYYSTSLGDYDFANRNHNVHFAYAIYSRRRQYMEGAGFSLDTSGISTRRDMIKINNQLYDPDNVSRGDLARSLGVDYVVVSPRFNDVGDLSNQDYEICFNNADMIIYKVMQ